MSLQSEQAARVREVIAHLERGVESGHAEEFRAAQALVRKCEAEALKTPGERERQALQANARRAQLALAGSAAAYQRYLATQQARRRNAR